MPDASETNPYDAAWQEDSEGRQFYCDPLGNTWFRDPDDPDTLHRVDADGKTFTRTPDGREIPHGPPVVIDQNVFTSPDGRTLTRVINGHMFRSGPDGYFMRYTGGVAERDPASGEWHAASKEAFDQAVAWNRELERILSTDAGRADMRYLSGLLELGAAAGLQGYMLGKIVAGAAESIAGLAEFAWSISPTRALIDPEGWQATMEQLGRGLRYAVDHPGAFFKAAVDWETWENDQLRAIGHLLPGALATIATAGSATAATAIDGIAGAAGRATGEAARAARAASKVASEAGDAAGAAAKLADEAAEAAGIARKASDKVDSAARLGADVLRAEPDGASAAPLDGVPSGFSPAGKGWLRWEVGLNIDEPLAVGEPGISAQEAMRRATDLNNRQLLDSLTNQATKREAVHWPIAPREPRAVVSVVDKPSAIIDRPLGEIQEWRELSEIILAKKSRALAGKSPKQARKLLNEALREELKHPTTAPGRLLSTTLERLLHKDASELFQSPEIGRVEWDRPRRRKGRTARTPTAQHGGGGPIGSRQSTEAAIADADAGQDPAIRPHRSDHTHSEDARPVGDSREPGRQPSAAVSGGDATPAPRAAHSGAADGGPARPTAPVHPVPGVEPSTGRIEPRAPTSPSPGGPTEPTPHPDTPGVADGRSRDPGAADIGGTTGVARGSASHVTTGEAQPDPLGSRTPEPSGAERERPAPDAPRPEKPSPEHKPHPAPRHTAPSHDRDDDHHRKSSSTPDPAGRTDAPPGPSHEGPPAAPPIGHVEVITPRGLVRVPIDGAQPPPDFKKWDENDKPPAQGEPGRPSDNGADTGKDDQSGQSTNAEPSGESRGADTEPHHSQAAFGHQPSVTESTAYADYGAAHAQDAADVKSGASLRFSAGYDPMDPLGCGAGPGGGMDPATACDPTDLLGLGQGGIGNPATGYDPLDVLGAAGGLGAQGGMDPATAHDPLDVLGAAGGLGAQGGMDPATAHDPMDPHGGLVATGGWMPAPGHDPTADLGGGVGGGLDGWTIHDPTAGAGLSMPLDGSDLPIPGAAGVGNSSSLFSGPGGGGSLFDPSADPLGGSGSPSNL